MALGTENKAETLRMLEVDEGGQERELIRGKEVKAGYLRILRVSDEGGAGWEE